MDTDGHRFWDNKGEDAKGLTRINTNQPRIIFNRGADDRQQTPMDLVKSEDRDPKSERNPKAEIRSMRDRNRGHELTRMLSGTNGYRFLNNQATKEQRLKRKAGDI